jgi:hypothetical protein
MSLAFATSDTAFTRAFSDEQSDDMDCFHLDRPARMTWPTRFYAAMAKALTTRPNDYPFDDLTLAVMVRRRD